MIYEDFYCFLTLIIIIIIIGGDSEGLQQTNWSKFEEARGQWPASSAARETVAS